MIPKDAREVYYNEQGEPIAYCPKESFGITDLERAEFYRLNEERLLQLAMRAKEKTAQSGEEQVVVCIDVDDPAWVDLVDALMPGHDWDAIRSRGEHPVARGVVPRVLIEPVVKEAYPAAGELANDRVNVLVFAAAGVAILPMSPYRKSAIPLIELPKAPPPTVRVEVQISEAAVQRAAEIDALVRMCDERIADADTRRREAHKQSELARHNLRAAAAAVDWLDAFVMPPAVMRAGAVAGDAYAELQMLDLSREMWELRREKLVDERKKIHDQFDAVFRAAVLITKDRFR